MIDIPEPSLPAEVSAVGTPLPTGPSSSQACQGAVAWLAALSPPLAGEQVNASLQVLAKVRRALTQGAVCYPGTFYPAISKPLASRGLFLPSAGDAGSRVVCALGVEWA